MSQTERPLLRLNNDTEIFVRSSGRSIELEIRHPGPGPKEDSLQGRIRYALLTKTEAAKLATRLAELAEARESREEYRPGFPY